jgi:hypothetical protein
MGSCGYLEACGSCFLINTGSKFLEILGEQAGDEFGLRVTSGGNRPRTADIVWKFPPKSPNYILIIKTKASSAKREKRIECLKISRLWMMTVTF